MWSQSKDIALWLDKSVFDALPAIDDDDDDDLYYFQKKIGRGRRDEEQHQQTFADHLPCDRHIGFSQQSHFTDKGIKA